MYPAWRYVTDAGSKTKLSVQRLLRSDRSMPFSDSLSMQFGKSPWLLTLWFSVQHHFGWEGQCPFDVSMNQEQEASCAGSEYAVATEVGTCYEYDTMCIVVQSSAAVVLYRPANLFTA